MGKPQPRLVVWAGKLSGAMGAVAAACMAALFLLMMAEIIARSFFSASLGFSWEISGYLMGAVIFLGAAQALRHGVHVRISLLLDMLPPRFAHALDILSTLMAAIIVGYMTYAFAKLGWTSWVRGTVSPTVVQTPLFIPQLAFTAGLVVLLLQILARFLALVLVGPEPRNAAAEGSTPQ